MIARSIIRLLLLTISLTGMFIGLAIGFTQAKYTLTWVANSSLPHPVGYHEAVLLDNFTFR